MWVSLYIVAAVLTFTALWVETRHHKKNAKTLAVFIVLSSIPLINGLIFAYLVLGILLPKLFKGLSRGN